MTKRNLPSLDKKITALVLQGGGALGAYQIGAVQAMTESGYTPDVVAGISIGSINAALIVGNEPKHRAERIQGFWNKIVRPDPFMLASSPEFFGPMFHLAGVYQAVMLGQPNFFTPRMIPPFFATPGTPEATSFYDTRALKPTLEQFVDFDRINARETHLVVGATRVVAGELKWFDNFEQDITSAHIAASGALPPGFPGERIDGDLYWDGGCVSNTPIDIVLDLYPHHKKRIFVPELFAGFGKEPKTMNEVMVRLKAIQYASHSAYIQRIVESYNKDVELYELKKKLNDTVAAIDQDKACCADKRLPEPQLGSAPSQLDVIRVVYQAEDYETYWMDTDFSPASIKRRSEAGYRAMTKAIAQRPWGDDHDGARAHLVSNGSIPRV